MKGSSSTISMLFHKNIQKCLPTFYTVLVINGLYILDKRKHKIYRTKELLIIDKSIQINVDL